MFLKGETLGNSLGQGERELTAHREQPTQPCSWPKSHYKTTKILARAQRALLKGLELPQDQAWMKVWKDGMPGCNPTRRGYQVSSAALQCGHLCATSGKSQNIWMLPPCLMPKLIQAMWLPSQLWVQKTHFMFFSCVK